MPTCFVAGSSNEKEVGYLTSEIWELQNMGNSQYIIGSKYNISCLMYYYYFDRIN